MSHDSSLEQPALVDAPGRFMKLHAALTPVAPIGCGSRYCPQQGEVMTLAGSLSNPHSTGLRASAARGSCSGPAADLYSSDSVKAGL